jgi:hypothetical protein
VKRGAGLSFGQIAAEIRSLVASNRVEFTRHAIEEMAKDGLRIANVLHVLLQGRVVEIQGAAKYKLEGVLPNGDFVSVIAAIQEIEREGKRVLVITVWKVNR